MFLQSTVGRQRAACIHDKAPLGVVGFMLAKFFSPIVDGGRRTASGTQNMIHENQGRRAYKLKEAATLLGVSTVSLRRAISRGLIKPSRAFRHVIIASEELDRFLRSTSSLDEGGKRS